MNNEENIIPEAGNLYSALRNSGYSNIAAIGDLIDNSLDAGAKTIKIDIAENLKQIFISDDGSGMSLEALNRALKLGGRKTHDDINDLGKYGLGLITASTSMGTKLKVITRQDGITNTGIFDVEEACNLNKFVALFRESNESEIRSFDFRTDNADSGTVLIIDNCDKIQYTNANEFRSELRDYLKSAFWSFIADGVKIFIDDGDKPVPSDDPLFRFDDRTRVIVKKTINVPMDNGEKEKLEILAVLIPDFEPRIKKIMRINIETQGFYVLRNNREIAPAVEILDVFKKHNDFNRLRIKLNFGPGLDEEMGVNYTKHNISPNRRMINILKHELEDEIKKLRKQFNDNKKEEKKEKEKERNNPFVKTEPSVRQVPSSGTPVEINETKNNIKDVDIKTKFQTEKDGLISFTVSGENASIWYNGANKFYQKKITEKENGSELKGYLDVVLRSFFEASIKNSIPAETIEKIVKDVSSALEKSEI